MTFESLKLDFLFFRVSLGIFFYVATSHGRTFIFLGNHIVQTRYIGFLISNTLVFSPCQSKVQEVPLSA